MQVEQLIGGVWMTREVSDVGAPTSDWEPVIEGQTVDRPDTNDVVAAPGGADALAIAIANNATGADGVNLADYGEDEEPEDEEADEADAEVEV